MTMIEQAARTARPLLELPLVRRTRRNHALEHAAIHVLSGRVRNLRVAGRSDPTGFVLLGDVATEAVEAAAEEALRRLRSGERSLAIHPNCGTNLVTTSFLTTLAALIGFGTAPRRKWLERIPTAMTLVVLALLVSPTIGTELQRHVTTDGDPADLTIIGITRSEMILPLLGRVTTHRITTRSR